MSETTDFTDFANQHPNYFPGQYLLEDDFELQHKYLSDRISYHNQSLHVSGIIEGLEVEVIANPNTKSVLIKSGSALDSSGNLIVLKENITFSDFNNLTDGELYIQYKQEKQQQQQKDVADSYTRWVEKTILGFATQTPKNSIKLAKLTIKDTISVDFNLREYSGISLPTPGSKALTLRSGGNANPNLAVLTDSLKIDGDLTVNGTGKSTFAGSLTINGNFQMESTSLVRVNYPGFVPNNQKLITFDTNYQKDSNRGRVNFFAPSNYYDNVPALTLAGNYGVGGRVGIMTTTPQAELDVNGNVSIGATSSPLPPVAKLDITSTTRTDTHPSAVKGLYVTGDFAPDSDGIEFRHTNGTQGIGFGYNTIYATGSNANQDLGLKAKGTGKVIISNGAIQPSAGDTENNGIMFPKNPGGGGDDAAWIRYYSRNPNSTDLTLKEQTTLEIGVSNDFNDHIALISSGGVGIGTKTPAAKLEVKGGQTKLEQEAWQTPTFQNNWANYGNTYNPAGYFKDSLGIVHLRGLVNTGNNNTTIFILPVGYRPSNRELLTVQTYSTNTATLNNTTGRVDILTDGQVTVVFGSNLWVSLDGLTFRAA